MQFKKTIPALPVINIDKAVDFYEIKMGFKARHKEKYFSILVRDFIEIHLWAACDRSRRFTFLWGIFKPIRTGSESFIAGTASCRIEVTDLEDLYKEYRKTQVLFDKKTTIVKQHWGDRDFPILDLHGNLITFFESDHS